MSVFYEVAFRKKIYNSLEELQNDGDVWIRATISNDYLGGNTVKV